MNIYKAILIQFVTKFFIINSLNSFNIKYLAEFCFSQKQFKFINILGSGSSPRSTNLSESSSSSYHDESNSSTRSPDTTTEDHSGSLMDYVNLIEVGYNAR